MTGEINSFPINGEVINSPGTIGHNAIGTLSGIEQQIGISGSGTLATIEQEILHKESGSGTLATIEQQVTDAGSGTLATIEQIILDANPSVKTHLQQYGWDVNIQVGNTTIGTELLMDSIIVTQTENSSRTCQFVVRPDAGVFDETLVIGKTVTVDYITLTDVERIFTGIVDIPRIDLIAEKIVYDCSSNRKILLNQQYQTEKNNIGFFSADLFSESDEVATEVTQRLTTIPFSLDFDRFNVGHLTAWEPKATPDISLTGDDLYLQDNPPELRLAESSDVINQITMTNTYRYERNLHNQRQVDWESPVLTSPCDFLTLGYYRIQRVTIQGAISGSSWVQRNAPSYDILPTGWYNCGGLLYFSNVQVSNVNAVTVTDGDGNIVTDADGNPINEVQTESLNNNGDTQIAAPIFTDWSNVFAESFSVDMTYRWSQTVEEVFEITVKSQQSIDQHGLNEEVSSHGVASQFDSTEWENYTTFTSGPDARYFIDNDDNISDFDSLYKTVANRAKTTILSSHRQNRVSIKSPIIPNTELYQTVDIDTARLEAKGKCVSLRHEIIVKKPYPRTEIQIALSRATGSSADDTISLPTRPTRSSVNFPTTQIKLDSRYAKELIEPHNLVQADGIDPTTGQFTNHGQSVNIEMPAIPDELRDTDVLTASEEYSVSIPNDTLVINILGKPLKD
jgi:hypothetical protein